jgi:hypothetical protein
VCVCVLQGCKVSAIKSMFGGQVVPPSNSPHLRKSGSRPVVFDLGRNNINKRLLLECSFRY